VHETGNNLLSSSVEGAHTTAATLAGPVSHDKHVGRLLQCAVSRRGLAPRKVRRNPRAPR